MDAQTTSRSHSHQGPKLTPRSHSWDPDSAVWPDARALSICGTGFQAVWLPCGLAQPRRGNHSYLLTVTVTGKSPAKAGPLLGP